MAPVDSQSIEAGSVLPYHLHAIGYFALVVKGGYVEAGDGGRSELAPGDVVYHPPYQCHFDRVGPVGANVLNLPAYSYSHPSGWVGRLPDPGRLLRKIERSPAECVDDIVVEAGGSPGSLLEWPDLLARDLQNARDVHLGAWARRAGLTPEALSRGFKRTYGAPPMRFRADARARRAWLEIVGASTPLASIAADMGFADQAHMTRAVGALTGRPPGAWRRDTRPVRADGYDR